MKKGQSALEFLMTYGWAISIVLVAIGALAYFGVLTPSNFLDSKCISSAPILCQGRPLINTSIIAFTLVNGGGKTVTLTTSSITGLSSGVTGAGTVSFCSSGTTSGSTCNVSTGVYGLPDGTPVTVSLTGLSGVTKGSIFKATVNVRYLNSDSGLSETTVVQISGKIK